MMNFLSRQISNLRMTPGTLFVVALTGYFIIFPLFMFGYDMNGVMGGIGFLVLAVPVIGFFVVLAVAGGEGWVGSVGIVFLLVIGLMCLSVSGPVLVNAFSRLFFNELWMEPPDVF